MLSQRAALAAVQHRCRCVGPVTRGSIFFARRWIAWSSQAMTRQIGQRMISYLPTSIARSAALKQTGGTAMNETKLTAAVVGLTLMLATHVPAGAAEIKVISSNALKTTLEQLAPAFEKATEHKLALIWGAAVPLKADI